MSQKNLPNQTNIIKAVEWRTYHSPEPCGWEFVGACVAWTNGATGGRTRTCLKHGGMPFDELGRGLTFLSISHTERLQLRGSPCTWETIVHFSDVDVERGRNLSQYMQLRLNVGLQGTLCSWTVCLCRCGWDYSPPAFCRQGNGDSKKNNTHSGEPMIESRAPGTKSRFSVFLL